MVLPLPGRFHAKVPHVLLTCDYVRSPLLYVVVQSNPEELNAGGFHVLGFDVMYCKARPSKQNKVTENTTKSPDGGSDAYCAHLLEVNCNPSLGIDSVYPCEGPAATRPVPPPASASWAAGWHDAMEVCSLPLCSSLL